MKRLAMMLVVAVLACAGDPTAPQAEAKIEEVEEQEPACSTFMGLTWCPSREHEIPDVRR